MPEKDEKEEKGPRVIHIIPGVPASDLTEDGKLTPARRRWHEQNNPAYPGYTGDPEAPAPKPYMDALAQKEAREAKEAKEAEKAEAAGEAPPPTSTPRPAQAPVEVAPDAVVVATVETKPAEPAKAEPKKANGGK
jgi:hypothetical protein